MTAHCPYCGDSIPDDEYETHLRRAHADDLTAIDQRRVGSIDDHSRHRRLGFYAGVAIVIVVFTLGYGVLFLGADGASSTAAVQPDAERPVHEHGLLTVQYDDRVVDVDDPQYLEADDCFHFHAHDNAQVWHVHCADVTLEYALETLGMDVTATTLAVDGQVYDEDAGDDVNVTVDGEAVDPQTHVLEGVESVAAAADGAGDSVEIVAQSGG